MKEEGGGPKIENFSPDVIRVALICGINATCSQTNDLFG